MTRPVQRIEPMLDLLRRVWEKYPDQRLGQVIGNAARLPAPEGAPSWIGGPYRDPFNVEDDEMWAGLRALASLEGPVTPPWVDRL